MGPTLNSNIYVISAWKGNYQIASLSPTNLVVVNRAAESIVLGFRVIQSFIPKWYGSTVIYNSLVLFLLSILRFRLIFKQKLNDVILQVCLACLLPLFLVPIVNILPLLYYFIMVSAIPHYIIFILPKLIMIINEIINQ